MNKFRQFLKHHLPDPMVRYLKDLESRLKHHGLILLLFPSVGKAFRLLPDPMLNFLKKIRVLSSDFVVLYAIPRKKRIKIMEAYNEDVFYLNIGAGLEHQKKHWRILEFCSDPIRTIGYRYPPELIDYDVDLMQLKSWDIPNNKADLIYTSNCLEHLSSEAAMVVFKEAYRIMKRGGVFRVLLPNIDLAYNAYLRNDLEFFTYNRPVTEQSIETHFVQYFTSFKLEECDIQKFKKDFSILDKESFLDKYVNKKSHEHDYHKHQSWNNFNKIKRIALEAGFKKKSIILSSYKQSICPEMRTKEFDNSTPQWSLYVEVIKD